jgi:hypothetical protein
MKRLFVACASLVLCLVSSPRGVAGNLVQNGDFETGDLSHWTVIGDPQFTGADATMISPHSGKWDAELFTFPSTPQQVVHLQQVLNRPTTPLTLTFWLKNDPGVNTSGVPSEFDVEWDSKVVFHLLDSETDTNYHMYTVILPLEMVEGGILQFDAIQNPSEWHLDDVSAVQGATVPEPSALVLSLLGGLGAPVLGWSLRREKV